MGGARQAFENLVQGDNSFRKRGRNGDAIMGGLLRDTAEQSSRFARPCRLVLTCPDPRRVSRAGGVPRPGSRPWDCFLCVPEVTPGRDVSSSCDGSLAAHDFPERL